ncbi:hypothetical protein [Tautonia plasticadhaerens]|uniref:Glycosyltransferase RgtA/B/C/D-like domain-containing protein n=1 Tax=Tautonia plasticadhaerens TaxID=2527974 RepID=A0A518GVS7_9BACT|nr:hypothetical protein [Tautonia plasticadhaerens]QDV32668.1 hypothetical protein ElP_05030 [Tautonia plasticadhaerens]
MSDGSNEPGSARAGLVVLLLALLPAASAPWIVPGFVTQDGPAHAYNAHILLESLRLGADSPFAAVYEPRWRPLPNLGGHLGLMGLLALLPPRPADRAMTTISLVGFALTIAWLRWRVAGRLGFPGAAVLSALLAINMPWLMGFSNFLIGATLLVLTLGLWWGWRDRLGPPRSAAIGLMLVLGYLGHLVSLGLTAGALVVLSVCSPGGDRRRRVGWTAVACLPMIPMALLYRSLTAEGGAFEPSWEQSGPILSPSLWARRLSWIDPVALGRRDLFPLRSGWDGPWCLALSPSLWLGLGLAVSVGGTVLGGRPTAGRDRRPWLVLSTLLLVGAAVGPDGFGDDHGYFLAQRVALVGLACLVPALELDPRTRPGRVASGLIALALALQTAFVWDYAAESGRRAGALLASTPEVGRGNRVGTLLVDIRGRYRANPLLHADSLLGVGTGNVIWSNYETRHYYFPVQLRPGVDAPPSLAFERIALLDDPEDADDRAEAWAGLLRSHGDAIDVVLCWGDAPGLDAITASWAGSGPGFESGSVRVYRRPGAGAGPLPARLRGRSPPPPFSPSDRLRPRMERSDSTSRPRGADAWSIGDDRPGT